MKNEGLINKFGKFIAHYPNILMTLSRKNMGLIGIKKLKQLV